MHQSCRESSILTAIWIQAIVRVGKVFGIDTTGGPNVLSDVYVIGLNSPMLWWSTKVRMGSGFSIGTGR